jgi:pimeloyl-ACP methyl ester carboxylesterase
LGGYIAAEVAIENKNLIEKLVLIDSSGMLKEPTPLLKDYRVAATDINPLTRHERVKRVLEDLYASPSRLLPVLVDLFNYTIEKPGAKHAFKSAFDNSTSTQLESERLIPIEYASMFTENLQRAKFEKIEDAGHSPFVEKTALVYEKLRTFLS